MNKYCYNCGIELEPDITRCKECGVRIISRVESSHRTLNLSVTSRRNVTFGLLVGFNFILLIASSFNGYYDMESINTWQFIISFFYSILLFVFSIYAFIVTSNEFQSGNASVTEKLINNIIFVVSFFAYFLILSAFIVGL